MKLYFDHATGAWQLPGQQAKAAARVDLPSTPADMVAWLQDHGVNPTRSESACPKCGDRPPIVAEIAESQDTGAMAEWILDHATQAQVEALFAAIGARWGEARQSSLRASAPVREPNQ